MDVFRVRLKKLLSYRTMKANQAHTPQQSAQEPISKTKLKATADALQALGVKLLDLSPQKLSQLNLPENLHEAIIEGKKIRANGALRRHRQYIGSLMREIDPEPIIEQFAKWEGHNQAENAFFHQLEKWREQLIQDDASVEKFISDHPQIDIQILRTLVRNARKEAQQNKPPKSSRLLFKLLREICENPAQTS